MSWRIIGFPSNRDLLHPLIRVIPRNGSVHDKWNSQDMEVICDSCVGIISSVKIHLTYITEEEESHISNMEINK